MQNKQNIQRTEGFDILRGIGITGIVLYHIFPSVFPGGFLGVPLFFVLSGYLMFVTSDRAWRRGKFHITGYYIKRLKKIFPPLFAMVMAVCCYFTLFDKSGLIGIQDEIKSIFLGYDNWWQIGRHASYFSKMSNSSPFTHLWFLAVEIQFYILWPFMFILYKKGCQIIGSKRMCFSFLITAIISAARMYLLYIPDTDPSRVYYGTDTMAFPLLIGIFLGAFTAQYNKSAPAGPDVAHASAPSSPCPRRNKGKTITLLCSFFAVICVLFVTVDGQNRFVYQGGMFFISVFFAAVIYIMEKQKELFKDAPTNSLMSFAGKKSYLIYLWHYPVAMLSLI